MDLREGVCSCKVPQLLHLPCSHMMTACTARGLDFETAMYMSFLYSREHTLHIWESSFEPYFDPSQWPEYNGPEYVPNPTQKRMKKGRRATKRIKGDMDESQLRIPADYPLKDFLSKKTNNLCSKCHTLAKECTCRKKKSRVVAEVLC